MTLAVKGSSMHPAIRSGDVVTVTPPGPRPVPIGAVVAAEAPMAGGLVVHRVVGRSGPNLLLRGDNATHADGEVPEAGLIGVVVRVERNGRLVRQAPGGIRRPFAALVRAGVVRRLNRLARARAEIRPERAAGPARTRQASRSRRAGQPAALAAAIDSPR